MAAWIPRLALAVLCAALLAGCGGNGGSENDTARDAAEAYVQARNQGDAGKVCELYSDELIQKLGASNCEAFVKEQTAGVATSFTLVSVRETGNQGLAVLQATAAGQQSGARLKITLAKQDGEWKVTSLGRSAAE
jgi:ketosteroid isomerase-like protein